MKTKRIIFVSFFMYFILISCDRINNCIENDAVVIKNQVFNVIDSSFYSSFHSVKLPIEFSLKEMYFVIDSTYALNEISPSNLKYIYETSNDVLISNPKYFKYGINYGKHLNYVFYIKKMENLDWLLYMICLSKDYRYIGRFIICGSMDFNFTRICSKITENNIAIIQINELSIQNQESQSKINNKNTDFMAIYRKIISYDIDSVNKITISKIDTSRHNVSLVKFYYNLSQVLNFTASSEINH